MGEIPEWAMEAAMEALKAARPAYDSQGQYDQHWESVARALVSAERRGIERAAKVAERDADWTAFRRRNSVNWKGEETNVFSAPPDPDDTMPTDANVFAYGIGILTGEVIAAAIRQLGDTP
jgi:hypothetical protein